MKLQKMLNDLLEIQIEIADHEDLGSATDKLDDLIQDLETELEGARSFKNVRMTVTAESGSWTEEYFYRKAASLRDVELFADEMIAAFNRTLRPGEEPRILLSAEFFPDGIPE